MIDDEFGPVPGQSPAVAAYLAIERDLKRGNLEDWESERLWKRLDRAWEALTEDEKREIVETDYDD